MLPLFENLGSNYVFPSNYEIVLYVFKSDISCCCTFLLFYLLLLFVKILYKQLYIFYKKLTLFYFIFSVLLLFHQFPASAVHFWKRIELVYQICTYFDCKYFIVSSSKNLLIYICIIRIIHINRANKYIFFIFRYIFSVQARI